ncbi:hypothetical protein A2316_00810 [Candidatus Falkowbacteria bacterium RIFOXYB2_FULL_38_15]|nr:MAG: hypothetical protein A2316_00810 [Candidatus Falkowbacteria bacterium RIFOXYB2_FULL_38_15]OGF42227.1 MAG: hypothetical protein A2555_03085 [Candidatus Falkowbacteria bacterium RIFOXYD2_FULL_39_16]
MAKNWLNSFLNNLDIKGSPFFLIDKKLNTIPRNIIKQKKTKTKTVPFGPKALGRRLNQKFKSKSL